MIYPPSESFFIKKDKIFYGLAPPLGLLYLATVLEKHGDTVSILDFSAEQYDKEKLVFEMKSADVIGITVLTISLKNTIDIIEEIKNENPKIPVVIGGPHCTLFPKKVLEESKADISVEGDGEESIISIKKAILGEINLSDINGIFYRKDDEILQGRPMQLISNLNDLSYPARHLVKKYVYGKYLDSNIKKGSFTSIITSRGCPFSCYFCSRNSPTMRRYRTRDINDIKKEIKQISNAGYNYLAFNDDCFLSNKKQAEEIFDFIIKERLDMKIFITAARVDSADEKLYFKMKKAGVCMLQFGLESGNQDVLDFYNKKTKLDEIRYAVNLSSKVGFFTVGSFILGAPFETKYHFKNTVSFAKSLPINSVSFLPLMYMAGSKLWNDAVSDGKISSDDYLVYADSNIKLGQFSKNQLINYCTNAQFSFYFRIKFIIDLIKICLKQNDFSFLNAYISFIFKR